MKDESNSNRPSEDSPTGAYRGTKSGEPTDSSLLYLQPGKLIAGRYKLLEPIGQGGMGSVWLAEQSEPVKRRVAVKLIKAGMDSQQVIARFDAERQALAVMDHPNIAKVLDGGLTDEERPYFVMEYVKGLPITQYCDRARLPVKQRLELFKSVCLAVQHAHQKGIIHRDLKPSNILVGLVDGRPSVKVIDFGLAKATGPSLTEQTLFTAHGMVLGTPLYMSPEQAESNVDIDTRTDIYSLGVILYELLTGTTPLNKDQIKQAAVGEIIRLIKDTDSPKPSSRIGSSEGLPSVAAQRSVDPAMLKRSVSGDLDWVVMKALEKDRRSRYETANGFAADIQRHLDDEPVAAGPPSARYRMKKFIRRNRVAVISLAATIIVGLLGTAAILAVQTRANARLRQANNELELANDRVTKINADLKASNIQAKQRFDLATQAIKLFHGQVGDDLVLKADQFKPLRDKLLQAAADFYSQLEALLKDQPDRDSRQAMCNAYFELGELTGEIGDRAAALVSHQKGLAVRRELNSGPDADLTSAIKLGESLFEVGVLLFSTGKPDEALSHFEEARELLSVLTDSTSDSAVGRALLGKTNSRIAYCFATTGNSSEAISAYENSIEVLTKLVEAGLATSESRGDLAVAHNFLGIMQTQIGRLDEAMESYQTALSIQQKLVDENPQVTDFQYRLAGTYNSIGILRMETGAKNEALQSYIQALRIQKKLADDNPARTDFRARVADGHHNIGLLQQQTGKWNDALESYRQAVATNQILVADNPADTGMQARLAAAHNSIGILSFQTGQLNDALQSYQSSLSIYQKLLDNNPTVNEYRHRLGDSNANIGRLQTRLGKPLDALESQKRAMAIRETLVDDNPDSDFYRSLLASSHHSIGNLLARFDRPDDALKSLQTSLLMYQTLAEKKPALVEYRSNFASVHLSKSDLLSNAGQRDEALELYQQALSIFQSLVDENPTVNEFKQGLAETHLGMGNLLLLHGRSDDALLAIERARSRFEELSASNPLSPDFRNQFAISLNEQGVILSELDQADKALESFEKAIGIQEELVNDHPSDVLLAGSQAHSMHSYALFQLGFGEAAAAVTTARKAIGMYESLPMPGGRQSFELACCHAALSTCAGKDDSGVPPSDAKSEADQAIAHLRQAISRGFTDADQLTTQTVFGSLSERSDFKALIESLPARDGATAR